MKYKVKSHLSLKCFPVVVFFRYLEVSKVEQMLSQDFRFALRAQFTGRVLYFHFKAIQINAGALEESSLISVVLLICQVSLVMPSNLLSCQRNVWHQNCIIRFFLHVCIARGLGRTSGVLHVICLINIDNHLSCTYGSTV